MTGRIVIRSSHMALNRRKSPGTLTPAETPARNMRKSCSNVGEVAGGTAANCVVVSCCCPCVLMECLILAVYRVPTILCRRILRRKKQKIMMMNEKKMKNNNKNKKEVVEYAKEGGSSVGEVYNKGYVDEVSDVDLKELEMIKVSIDGSAVELDKQMWDRFHNTGFWRSPSQRYDEFIH